jgi:hypothetical protein
MAQQALVVFPRGGLANRLRVVASANIMANHTGRKLFVNWELTEECHCRWSDLFANPVDEFPESLASLEASAKCYAGGFDHWGCLGPGEINRDTEPIVVAATYCAFKPVAMKYGHYMKAKSEYYKSLVPITIVGDAVTKTVDHEFKQHRIVGVHIRRTDLIIPLFGNRPHKASPTRMFIGHMKTLLADDPNTLFFLATDDAREQHIIMERFPRQVVVYNKTNVSRGTIEGMQDALIDWLLLSRTSQIIKSYWSAFSDEAAAVHQIEITNIRSRWWYLLRLLKR